MKVSLVHMQTGRGGGAGKEGMGKEGDDREGKEKRRAAREEEEYKIG